ncbi:FHA domain-containing protein [Silvibacterium dinghuense]|uniref:FHA domain-containing protein n=1 Tax=Silvibacterium dinghuense TaxID=1560006 RepID=A0A4Q1SJ49_9BACT|nr:FHA domain-containing protein [Silvibacterium dinghuense]RXS97445.1 hypothetical protein ESZ00_05985 [Silvibacterium dinghuense]
MGTLGGLLAAVLGILFMVPLADSGLRYLPDSVDLGCFAVIISIALFLYFDRILLGRMRAASLGYGLLFGGVSGILAALLSIGLHHAVADTSPSLFRLAVWALCISVIGLGIGLRWANSNRARVLHTYSGSLVGGLLGGAMFVLFGPHIPGGASIAGLMLAGAGTGFGTGIAPTLIREGSLRFISSGDARAQNKLGKERKLWALDIDESYVIGSATTAQNGTKFQQGADISVPDVAIAPRHAVVFSREGRYFIARHPDVGGPEGIAKYVLRARGKTVVGSQELHPSDDILIGRTALRFESKKGGA